MHIPMKKTSLFLNRIAFIIAFIASFCIINIVLRFLIIDDTQSYTRIMLKEMYEQKDIEVLFLGSSHSYRSINPSIFDEKWGVNTFNAGTSSQQADGSYYLLREVGRTHELKRVYMEVYYDILGQNGSYQSATATYIISDYMQMSSNRLKYIWESGGMNYLIHGLLLPCRNWESLFDMTYIRDMLHKKMNPNYLSYEYVYGEYEHYQGKGFVYSKDVDNSDFFTATSHFAPIPRDALSLKSKEYLDRIISYCQKEGIEIIFYSAPISDFRLADVGNYDYYVMQMKEFLKEKGVAYYDFNLCRPEFLSLDEKYFQDNHHLNGEGANTFSTAFAQLLSEENPEKAFYHSYGEKLEESPPKVYGLICESAETVDNVVKYTVTPITNKVNKAYYAIYKRKENEEKYDILRTYQEERDFLLPANENGYMYIYMTLDKEGKVPINEAQFYY